MRSVRGVRELHWFAADDLAPILVWLRDRVRLGVGVGLRRMGKTR